MEKGYLEIKNKLKALFAKKTSLQGRARSVMYDWFSILGAATVLAILFCFVGVYVFFFELGPSRVNEGTEKLPKATFNRERLTEVVSQYKKQNEEFANLRSVPPEIPLTGTVESVQEEVPAEEVVSEVE